MKVAVLIASVLLLTGCYTPPRTAGAEHAIAVYRDLFPAHTASRRAPGAPAALSVSSAASASSASSASSTTPSALTADEAVAMAKKHSAQLSAMEARAALAGAEVEATNRHPNPELRVSQVRLDQFLDGRPQVRTAIRLSPERPGEVDAKVAEARAAEAAARAEARAEELAIEAEVRWLFDDVLLLDAEIAAAEAVAGARRSLAARMKARLDASEATAMDEAMAELSAALAEQDSAERRERRNAALGELLDRLGLAQDAQVHIVGDPLAAWPPPALPAEEALVEAALRSRPEIEIAAARIDAASARAFVERGKRWPWFSFVELGYEFAPGVAKGLGWTFQTGLALPLFDTNRGGVRASDAANVAAKRELAAAVEQVAREVHQRLREAEAARALVSAFRGRALPAAERAAQEAQRALEGRDIDMIRALAVDERRVVVDLRLLGLLRRYRIAVAALRRAVGGRLPASP